jgi:hypothetical protein
MIVKSTSKYDPFIYIQCIKKKPSGEWEKPTNNEGKFIKISLEETVFIIQVLNRQKKTWQCKHNYKDLSTSISFSWEDDQSEFLWINIGDYSKMLDFAQAEVFRLLITHILDEKIIFSTDRNIN